MWISSLIPTYPQPNKIIRIHKKERYKDATLCCTITRPAFANERLTLNRAGQVVLTLKTPYRDGTTHSVMSPLEFMQRLAALVPRPRLHLIRFHGVLAPNARLRPEIIPSSGRPAGDVPVAVRPCRSTPIPPQPTTPRRSLPRRPPA
ncbi:MAG: transposase [Gammaproteobacteria bacterium]